MRHGEWRAQSDPPAPMLAGQEARRRHRNGCQLAIFENCLFYAQTRPVARSWASRRVIHAQIWRITKSTDSLLQSQSEN
jgi:hypothetical protein